MSGENWVIYLRYSRNRAPGILYAAKLIFFKYKGHRQTYQNIRTQEILFPQAPSEQSTVEWVLENQK